MYIDRRTSSNKAAAEGKAFVVSTAIPPIPKKPAPEAQPEQPEAAQEPTAIAGRKRTAEEADLGDGKDGGDSAKKFKSDGKGRILIDDSDDDVVMNGNDKGKGNGQASADPNVIDLD